MADAHTIIVNRTDYTDLKNTSLPAGKLQDGHIRVAIGPFALTANNITYVVTGDIIGYWKYFEPAHYGINDTGYGRMPVWGYGTVTDSRHKDFTTGEIIYGFFPVATEIDLKPDHISDLAFMDTAEHRVNLHPIYNQYVRTENDPSFVPALHEIQPVLRPLFTTSFLIDDQFADDDFYGAEQIIIISASSKTALGTAFCLQTRKGPTIVGLTSARNADFVTETGFYDTVHTYDSLAAIDANKPTAIIDMAGNGDVTRQLYDILGEKIVYNCMVGKSHWDGASPPKPAKGAPATMFFAPDRAKMRIKQWGGAGFAKNLAEKWLPFCQSAKSWLNIETYEDEAKFREIYSTFLNGQADPAKGYLFSLK